MTEILNLHSNAKAYHDKDVSSNYVKGRPSYPIEAIKMLKEDLGLTIDSKIMDLACGTGKFSKMICEADFKNVVCVEPSPEFRVDCSYVLKEFIDDKNKDIQVVNGLATSLPFENSTFDCICAAQSFHWYDNVDAIKEITRVLKPGGVLYLIWNNLSEDDNPIFQSTMELFRNNKQYTDDNSPKFRTGKWKQVFEDIKNDETLSKTLIDPNLQLRKFKNEQITNCEKIIATTLSISFIALFPQEKKDKLVSMIKKSLDSLEDSKDNKDFPMIYQTEVYFTKKPIV
ncbi:hypothetical protein DDB_G0290001 [Dictyostelium discoideum AX4]|uniref:Methyltransferase type 11 domain-containing protein n=1 Tax=Dictyostelium discoideum TaxID=44689 RepID=Q54GQ2_DICDI|nr:hypothetical protein DDB_G0290001 [Dictyostelium discoideum AX4]EAL62446.1 hypothetical protein DDB_G0290001 [Dictyostelium discoideum AX4]|eukprot:XP_635950.1 hypothetical protein DDB_G0290001 [Dictyostelium discoideum AX4]